MENKYTFSKYVYLSRWVSYWYQISEVLKLEPDNLLIIGVGDGIVADILKRNIPEVKTLDIDKKLGPDIVSSVNDMSLGNDSFDVILCAEVLEHLPFDKFEKSLHEIKKISKKYVILSLPHFSPQFKISFKLPFIKEVKISFKIPFPKKHKFTGEHYWEIGKKGYSSTKIRNIIKKYFNIKREFTPFENQYHHFYILKK